MSLHLNSWIPWFVIFHQQIWVQIFLNFHLCSGRKVTAPSRPFFKFCQETIQTLLWSGWQLRTGKTQSKMKQKNWLLCSFSFLRAKSLKILGPRNRSSIGKSGYTHTHTHTRQARTWNHGELLYGQEELISTVLSHYLCGSTCHCSLVYPSTPSWCSPQCM